ncbi:GNAT family protein [Dokdonia sp.]|uniref:GNAT family N-acetyltransferase n=1 Tax=Dokdonia sp. TaxID=2024995 RepID=UPI003263A1EB
MKNEFDITVREIQLKDVDLITDYWLKSDPDHLIQMGVDLNRLPKRNKLVEALTQQVNNSITDKKSYALIWELNGKQIGHSNVNNIEYGKVATMHLHLWESTNRKKGIGTELVKKSIPFYFEKLKIKKIICEPYALNPAPNRTLSNVGFEFIKKYRTIPGTLNFEQEVNRWELTEEHYKALY